MVTADYGQLTFLDMSILLKINAATIRDYVVYIQISSFLQEEVTGH